MSFMETSNVNCILMPDKNQHPKCNFWIQQILKFIFSLREQRGRNFSGIGILKNSTLCSERLEAGGAED